MNEKLFGTKLGSTIQVHGIDCFISAERKNLLHALINGGIDDVFGADDVRLNGLKRIVLASRHLLECSRMDHDVHAMKRPLQPIQVAHVSDKIADRDWTVLREQLPHFMLLEFIAAEDDQLLWTEFLENDLSELLSKRTGSTGHKHDLIFPTHYSFLEERGLFLHHRLQFAPSISSYLAASRVFQARSRHRLPSYPDGEAE